MNVNLYLDDQTARRLDALARATRTPRNAIVRRAVAAWLDRGGRNWPELILDFPGDPSFSGFEASRDELAEPPSDPFSEPPSKQRSHNRRRTPGRRRKL